MSDVSMKLGIETAKCESLVRYLIMNECGENVFVVKGEKTCPFMANCHVFKNLAATGCNQRMLQRWQRCAYFLDPNQTFFFPNQVALPVPVGLEVGLPLSLVALEVEVKEPGRLQVRLGIKIKVSVTSHYVINASLGKQSCGINESSKTNLSLLGMVLLI